MAADQITYADKVGIVPKTAQINQVWDDDMNEIKLKHNNNADLLDLTVDDTDTNTLDIVDLQADKANANTLATKTADYTAIINNYVLADATSAEVTITLPTAIGNGGQEINVTKKDSSGNNVVVDTTLSQTIIGLTEVTISSQYDNITFVSDNANWLIK